MNIRKDHKNEYKTRNDKVGNIIHKELCDILKFDHTTILYIHKPESVLENEQHKTPENFEIQTNNLI